MGEPCRLYMASLRWLSVRQPRRRFALAHLAQAGDGFELLGARPGLAALPLVDRQRRHAEDLRQRRSRQAEPATLRGKTLGAEAQPRAAIGLFRLRARGRTGHGAGLALDLLFQGLEPPLELG